MKQTYRIRHPHFARFVQHLDQTYCAGVLTVTPLSVLESQPPELLRHDLPHKLQFRSDVTPTTFQQWIEGGRLRFGRG